MDDLDEDFMFETIDQIYEDDIVNYREANTGDYYIGMAHKDECDQCNSGEPIFVLASHISAKSFFSHNLYISHCYLYHYNMFICEDTEHPHKQIEIMKLIVLEDGTFSVLLKTVWLRLVQRRWKKIMQNRKDQLRKKCSLRALNTREMIGKFPLELRREMGIMGMMTN
jgi:hypothetical protein